MLAAALERPKIAEASLSVLLLAPNPGADLDAMVRDWRAWLDQRPGDIELLVVVGGREATTTPASVDPRVRIIHQVAPPGLGPSLQTGIWLARFPLTLVAPADRQFQPTNMQRLFEHIDHVDLVAGCRVERPPPWWLRALSLVKRLVMRVLIGFGGEPRQGWLGWRGWGRRWVAKHIFGVKLRDPESPVGLFRTEVLRRIPIQAQGSFVHVEIAAKANHLGCLMTEAPVPWTRPEREVLDPSWRADCARVRREPEFGPPSPVVGAGVSSPDLIASGHGTAS